MKKLIIFILPVLLLASCTKDEDEFDAREKFIGSWKCDETSTIFGTSAYTVTISKSAVAEDRVKLFNLYNLGSTIAIDATVSGNSLSIYTQTTSTGQTVNGSGNLNGNSKINLTYTSNDGQDTDNVTAELTKK